MFFVISGPSGVGKSTIIHQILAFYSKYFPLNFAVSHTTRRARRKVDGTWEIHGKDYYFSDLSEFFHLISAGAFVEFVERYGNYYGTSTAEVERLRKAGKPTIFDLDPFGGLKVKELYPNTQLIYVAPPSLHELERRLLERSLVAAINPDTEDDIKLRIEVKDIASQLYMGKCYYDHVVINHSLNATVAEICNHIITPALTRVIEEYDPEFADAFPIPLYPRLEEM